MYYVETLGRCMRRFLSLNYYYIHYATNITKMLSF